MPFPKMLPIRQTFDRQQIESIETEVAEQLARLELGKRIRPGQSVALTAGSRGIANIPRILKSVVEHLTQLGAKPFVVPAMGSHGGATAEGQKHILESYGITEEYLGVPVRASMDVISLGTTSEGYPVYLDRIASEADHIGVVGRVKPHTGYHGPVESGLLKMIMIGLGKHKGALAAHRILLEQPYDQVVRSISRVVRDKGSIAFGLAIVENAYDHTALLEAVPPEDFEAREEVLLTEARNRLAKLPYREVDLLVVDEIGKNISGSGMDTNIVGRKRAFRFAPPPESQPNMRQIFVRGLHEKTHGNAAGIGLADFTTRRLVDEMNYKATAINCLTAGYPEGANIPVHFETDREVIDAALKIIGTREPQDARIVHIRNTLDLEKVFVSEPCLQDDAQTKYVILGDPLPMQFDDAENLPGVTGR